MADSLTLTINPDDRNTQQLQLNTNEINLPDSDQTQPPEITNVLENSQTTEIKQNLNNSTVDFTMDTEDNDQSSQSQSQSLLSGTPVGTKKG